MSYTRTLLVSSALIAFYTGSALAQSPASVVATPPSTATQPAKSSTSPVTRAEMPEVIRETLLEHPEILTDVMKKLHDKQVERAKEETKESLTKLQDELFKSDTYPYVGAKDADVTVVQFFDYHCGYCKRMLPTINALIKQDKKVRVVFRDFPILSEDSGLAARAAVAVHRIAPAKYFDYHTALMKMSGKYDEKNLTEAAKKLGIDAKKFKETLEDKKTTELVDANHDTAQQLGIRGTPAFALPDSVVPGAIPLDDLQKLIDDLRSGVKP